MSRTLVTVICNRDMYQVELLCRTMYKYLKRCRVVFIFNENREESSKLHKWFLQTCAPHLKNFQVSYYSKYDFWSEKDENHLTELELEGWVDQQVLKLLVCEKIKTEHYVTFDAKNFFINHTYIEEIAQIKPAITDWCEPILQNWIINCLETFNLDIPEKPIRLTQNTTPYVIRTQSAKELVKYFGGNSFLFKWFSIEARKDRLSPAEFFLYETWTIKNGWRNLGDSVQNCIGFWEHMIVDEKMTQPDMVKYIRSLIRHFDVRVAGIHKGLRAYWSEQDLFFVLKRLGVTDCIPKHTPSPFKNRALLTK